MDRGRVKAHHGLWPRLDWVRFVLARRLKAMGSKEYQTDGDPRSYGPGFDVATDSQAVCMRRGIGAIHAWSS